jgi:hypothetical protein
METRYDIASPIQPHVEVVSPRVTGELLQAGAVEKLSDYAEIWHGRALHVAEETWHVDPFLNGNGGNIYTGVLYATPHRRDAEAFARARAGLYKPGSKSAALLTPSVERLIPTPSSLVVTGDCSPNLGSQICIKDVTDAVPISSAIESRAIDVIRTRKDEMLRAGTAFCTEHDAIVFARKTCPENVAEDDWTRAILKYASARNSQLLVAGGNLKKAVKAMVGEDYGDGISTLKLATSIDSRGIERHQMVPFSREYIAEVFRRANIVGKKMDVWSATLNRDVDDVLVLWDKSSVQTQVRELAYEKVIGGSFRGVERGLAHFSVVPKEKIKDEGLRRLRTVVQDPYASPAEVLRTAGMTVLGPRLERSVGVKERYVLREHTEAVLSMFERYYADRMPAAAMGFMRTVLFLHDIGKPDAVQTGSRQEPLNRAHATETMEKMGYDRRDVHLVVSLITTGDRLYSNYVRYNVGKSELEDFEASYAELLFGTRDNTKKVAVRALLDMLYNCDAGAYTEKARYTKGDRMVRALRSLDYVFEFAPHGTHRIRRAKRAQ